MSQDVDDRLQQPVASTSGPPSPLSRSHILAVSAASDSDPSCLLPPPAISDIEKRLQAAVQRLETVSESEPQNGQATSSGADIDNDDCDNDDMYYNHPEDAATTIAPFVPLHPLQPLEVVYIPRHRLLVKPLRQVVRARIDATRQARKSTSPRSVSFADCVEVVDVFAASDYPGRWVFPVTLSRALSDVFAIARRGPSPIERLTMRDILELRQIKIELGVHGKNDPNAGDEEDESPSTPFERMNILESTPLSPGSSLGHSSSPFRAGFSVGTMDGAALPQKGGTPSAASLYLSGLSSTSLSISTSSYFDSAASSGSIHPDSSQGGAAVQSSYASGLSGSIVFLDPKASHLLREREREASPDSLGAGTASTSASAFSSPTLSLSCSPSASDSDYLYSATDVDERDKCSLANEEDEDDYAYDDLKSPLADHQQQPKQQEGPDADTTFRVAEFGHARASVRLKADSPPRRRSRNADYFKVPVPALSKCSIATSDIMSASSGSGPDLPDRLESPLAIAPIIMLDRPWGLQS